MACTFDMEGVKRLTLKEGKEEGGKKELHLGKLDTSSSASKSVGQDLRNKGLKSYSITSKSYIVDTAYMVARCLRS